MKTLQTKHESGPDCLRVISMLMVVTLHFCIKGNNLISALSIYQTTGNYLVIWLLRALAFCGVNCFVLITGSFGWKSKFHVARTLRLWGTVFFYSVALYALAICTADATFSLRGFVSAFLPISSGQYWFATSYFILMLLQPFLNYGIVRMNRNQHAACAIVMTVLFCVIPTVTKPFGDVMQVSSGFSPLWFITLYLIASYVAKYGLCVRKKSYWLSGYFLFSALTFLSVVCITLVTTRIAGHPVYETILFTYNSPTVLGAAVCLLQFFRQIKKQNAISTFCCRIAPFVFGVYLLHDHPQLKQFVWRIIDPCKYADSPLLIGYLLLSCCCIFAVGILVELLRKFLENAIFRIPPIARLVDKLQRKTDKILLEESK